MAKSRPMMEQLGKVLRDDAAEREALVKKIKVCWGLGSIRPPHKPLPAPAAAATAAAR